MTFDEWLFWLACFIWLVWGVDSICGAIADLRFYFKNRFDSDSECDSIEVNKAGKDQSSRKES